MSNYARKMNTPYLVRSVHEQYVKELAACRCVPMLRERYSKRQGDSRSEKLQRERIALAIRELTVPMYGIEVEGFRYFVSYSIIADYRENGIRPLIFAMPVFRRCGKSAGRIKTKQIANWSNICART